jgi:hypothetical protein
MSWPGGDDEHIDDRERRVIRNEALFREVNERIEDVSEDVSRADFIEFLCECGEEACIERIELSREEYEDIRPGTEPRSSSSARLRGVAAAAPDDSQGGAIRGGGVPALKA